ncbi:hypothetical protein CY35_06G017600 [Sphagnum magellanicum]|nr:hypothetical protein CY35_06G017600 [Sphagnum magellanicum]
MSLGCLCAASPASLHCANVYCKFPLHLVEISTRYNFFGELISAVFMSFRISGSDVFATIPNYVLTSMMRFTAFVRNGIKSDFPKLSAILTVTAVIFSILC